MGPLRRRPNKQRPGASIVRGFMVCLICGVSLLGLMSIMNEQTQSPKQLGPANAPPAGASLRGAGAPAVLVSGVGGDGGAAASRLLPADSIYRLHAVADLDLGALAGKVSLVVNVASH